MKPEEFLKESQRLYKQMQIAKKSYVAVGLPLDKVGQKIYNNGMTIFSIGAVHEFGASVQGFDIPRRSFLRVPFATKKAEIADQMAKEWKAVFDGKRDAKQALGRFGIFAENISRGAFTTKGYGQWPDIQPATKKAKGSSQVLIDTGTLRNSITSIVRSN